MPGRAGAPSPKVFGAHPPPRCTSHKATGELSTQGDAFAEGGPWQQWHGQSPQGQQCRGPPRGTREPPAGTKAAAAATSPNQRHLRGQTMTWFLCHRGKRDVPPAWKHFGEEQAPPHQRQPRERCGFCFQATLAFLKPDKQDKEMLFRASQTRGSRILGRSPAVSSWELERSRSGKAAAPRGHTAPRALGPASQKLSDVNMAFVSQGAAVVFSGLLSPTAERFKPRG